MTAAVDIFSEFAISETKSQEGVWVPYKDGVEFLIAKSGKKVPPLGRIPDEQEQAHP